MCFRGSLQPEITLWLTVTWMTKEPRPGPGLLVASCIEFFCFVPLLWYPNISLSCATFRNQLSLAKFTSVSCAMLLDRRVLIKSPADALLKHRFVSRQVSCVTAQGDDLFLWKIDGWTFWRMDIFPSVPFSFRQRLLLSKWPGQHPGAVLQRCFLSVHFLSNRIEISWFTVPTQSCSQCDICWKFLPHTAVKLRFSGYSSVGSPESLADNFFLHVVCAQVEKQHPCLNTW